MRALTTKHAQAAASIAAATRRANAERLLKNFPDEVKWRDCAAKLAIDLPRYGVPVTPGAIEKWLRVLHIDVRDYRKKEGGGTLAEIAARYDQQCLPLRAWVGMLMIEMASPIDEVEKGTGEEPELLPVYCRECGKLLLPGLIEGASVLHCGVWSYPSNPCEKSARAA